MIIVNTSNEELLKSVKDDMDRLQAEAEDALDENEKEAKEIAKNHGEDTKGLKKVVSKDDLKDLKSMHLAESLFDDADDYFYLNIIGVCDAFKDGDISIDDLIDELTYIREHMNDDEDVQYEIPGFEGTKDALDKLTIYGESLNEDLSPKGKKLIAELKQELGPELQRKVVALMKDLQTSLTQNKKDEDKQTNESLTESMWSVYYIDDDPQEGTLFAEEDDARKFQAEMGDEWEVVQLPDTAWDAIADKL